MFRFPPPPPSSPPPRYEKIFGEGYVSSGGPDTTQEFVKSLNLRPGDRVLDLGCGIGGGDFYMVSYTSPPPSHFRLFFSPLVLATQSPSTSFVNPLFVYVPYLEDREQNRVYPILPVCNGGCVPYPPLPPSPV